MARHPIRPEMHTRALLFTLILTLTASCAAPRAWRESSGVLEHVPTGLTFPATLDGLDRQPVASLLDPDAEVIVSYGPDASTGLRITLSPLAPDTHLDLQAVLDAEARAHAALHPSSVRGFGGSFPVHCGSEVVTFSFQTFFPEAPSTSRPPEGYSLRVGGGSMGDLDWWFGAQLSRHLVVIDSRISRHRGAYDGADLALRDLLVPLGWPCELPQPLEVRADPEDDRGNPPERSLTQSAGVLLARALPAGGFDERSTLGPRPVVREPAPGTYGQASETGRPYLCETSAPAFFGEREVYRTYVEGNDFVAPGRLIHFARVDGVGYAWSDEPLGEDDVLVLNAIRLDAFAHAYQRLMHHPPPRWDDLFTFVEPAARDACVPTTAQTIELPEREIRDVTDALVARQREIFDAAIAVLEALPFTPRLPHPSLLALFPGARGYATAEGYSIQYLAHGAGPGGESSELTIGFRAYSEEEPASRCGERRATQSCEHFATTKQGHELFRALELISSSSRDPRLPRYYAKVGDALVRLDYTYWRHSPRGATGWRTHDFAPGELGAIFDSLRHASPEDVVRFPGMGVSQ